MRKIIILTSVLFVSVIAAAVIYFSQLSGATQNNNKILARIPREAALIFQFKSDNITRDLFKNYELFDIILGEKRAVEINQLKNLLSMHQELLESEHTQNIFFSFFPNKMDSIDILWTMTTGNKLSTSEIQEALLQPSNEIVTKKSTIFKKEILELKFGVLDKVLYVFIEDGIAAGSFSKDLITQFINPATPKINKELIVQINSSSLKNVNSPFNAFINHGTTFSFTRNFLRNKPDGNLQLLNQLKGFTSLNMNFKNDALMFNGISKVDTSSSNYLNLFLGQQPVITELKKAFPENTANYLSFGISNYPKFHSDLLKLLNKRKELRELSKQIDRLKNKYTINLDRDMASLWANELAVLQLSSTEKLSVIALKDGRKMGFLLEEMSSAVTETLRRFNDSNMLYYYFGDPLKPYIRPYFSIIDNYLIVANNASILQRFTDNYSTDKLLYKTPEFADFSQFTANQSNISYFIHSKNSKLIYGNDLRSNYAGLFTGTSKSYTDFYGLAYQWTADKDHFFINLYANYTATKTNQLDLAWQVPLKGQIANTPQIFIGRSNEKIILVQDNINNLYCFSSSGKRIWSRQLQNRILGDIHQLDDYSLIFNTSSELYHLDPSGDHTENFPVNISQSASYGLTLINGNQTNAKIFIPCSTKILGFDLSGKLLPEWNKELNGKILFDVKTTKLNNIDYLIAGTENGSFYFFNHNGGLVGKADEKTKFSNPINLMMGAEIKTSRIITTDTTGTVKSIFFDGKVSSQSTGVWSAEHVFALQNITGEPAKELIYLDKSQLFVYNSSSRLEFNYDFGLSSTYPPQFFPSNQTRYRIGILVNQGNLLYLFDEDGNLAKGFPVKGIRSFFVGAINNSGRQYLICGGTDNNLLAYRL